MTDLAQIAAASGALVTAVILVVNALKATGVPGKVMPILSILLGVGGAYLTVSHDPAVFIIVGILVTGTETGVYYLNKSNIEGAFVAKLEDEPSDTEGK